MWVTHSATRCSTTLCLVSFLTLSAVLTRVLDDSHRHHKCRRHHKDSFYPPTVLHDVNVIIEAM